MMLFPVLRDSGLEVSEEDKLEIIKINKFFFLVRYPDLNRKFFATPEVAQETLKKTKEIFLWIENKLKK